MNKKTLLFFLMFLIATPSLGQDIPQPNHNTKAGNMVFNDVLVAFKDCEGYHLGKVASPCHTIHTDVYQNSYSLQVLKIHPEDFSNYQDTTFQLPNIVSLSLKDTTEFSLPKLEQMENYLDSIQDIIDSVFQLSPYIDFTSKALNKSIKDDVRLTRKAKMTRRCVKNNDYLMRYRFVIMSFEAEYVGFVFLSQIMYLPEEEFMANNKTHYFRINNIFDVRPYKGNIKMPLHFRDKIKKY